MTRKEKLKFISDFDLINFYHLNKSSLPPEFVAEFEKNYDSLYFMSNVMMPFFRDIHDPAYQLMMKQFPVFQKEKRPTLVKEMESICNVAGFDMILMLGKIMQLKAEGKSVIDAYAPFDQWVKDNTFPKDTWEKVKNRERIEFGALNKTDEEWEEIKKEENHFRREEIKWIKRRRFEYMELLQNVMLTHFKGFEQLEAPELIVYSLYLRKEYEDYNDHCQIIEDFIDWGLPEEDYKLNFSEQLTKRVALGNEKRWEVNELRYRRVYGEEI